MGLLKRTRRLAERVGQQQAAQTRRADPIMRWPAAGNFGSGERYVNDTQRADVNDPAPPKASWW